MSSVKLGLSNMLVKKAFFGRNPKNGLDVGPASFHEEKK